MSSCPWGEGELFREGCCRVSPGPGGDKLKDLTMTEGESQGAGDETIGSWRGHGPSTRHVGQVSAT